MKIIQESDFIFTLISLGVNPLSGEGCRMGTRIDTDVSPEATPLIEEYFGGIKLTHAGFNGWSIDPDGKCHAGRQQAWDYEKKAQKEGWSTRDGFCFKLPESMISEILVFLLLRQKDSPEYLIRVAGKRIENVGAIPGKIILLDKEEKDIFMSMSTVEEYVFDLSRHEEVEREGYYFWKQVKMYEVGWRSFNKSKAGSNRHSWTGKEIA